jgi:hypothetical protein
VTTTSRGGEPAALREPTSQDSPLPATAVGSLFFMELFASLFPMDVVGDSLRAQPPILAIERTDRMARRAIDPVFGCIESSAPAGVADREGAGAGDAALFRVYADEMEEKGPDCMRTLDGWEPGAGAGTYVSHHGEISKVVSRTTAAKLFLSVFTTSAQCPFPFLFVGLLLVRLDSRT